MGHSEGEELARYLFDKNHFRISDDTVKYSAFIPPHDKRLSVFKISELREDEIWKIGVSLRARKLLGRADIKAGFIINTGLAIEADDTPPRHASIICWPEESSAVKLIAIELAEKATLHLYHKQTF